MKYGALFSILLILGSSFQATLAYGDPGRREQANRPSAWNADNIMGVSSSAMELAGGVGMIFTGVGTPLGVVVAIKGAADLAVNVGNVIEFMETGKQGVAGGAIGYAAAKVGEWRSGGDPRTIARYAVFGNFGDLATDAVLVFVPGGVGRLFLKAHAFIERGAYIVYNARKAKYVLFGLRTAAGGVALHGVQSYPVMMQDFVGGFAPDTTRAPKVTPATAVTPVR